MPGLEFRESRTLGLQWGDFLHEEDGEIDVKALLALDIWVSEVENENAISLGSFLPNYTHRERWKVKAENGTPSGILFPEATVSPWVMVRPSLTLVNSDRKIARGFTNDNIVFHC